MKFSAFIAAILLSVSLIACGGDNGDNGDGDTTMGTDTTPVTPPVTPPPADTNNMDTTHADSM